MIDRVTFDRYVSQALARMSDRLYLRTHPLAQLLAPPDEQTGDALAAILVAAIEQLHPPPPTIPTSPAWRRYRHLVLRYVEGASLEATARDLLVSLRQAHRDHAEAFRLLSEYLWSFYQRIYQEPRPSADLADADGSIETELRRIVAESPETPSDLIEAVRGALGTFRRVADERGFQLNAVLPDGPVLVDVTHLATRQVVLNVLSHAVEIAEPSGINVEIVEKATFAEVHVRAERPVAREDKAAIRDLNVESGRVLIGAARRLLEMHGGAIRSDASDRCRPRVTLTFPAVRVPTVLLIDDNPDLSRLFRRHLVGIAYRLIQATTAEHALRLAREARPSLIILDVLLPSSDGWEILQDLRSCEETRQIPVIVCSVLPTRTLAQALGVVEFLAKPVGAAELVSAIERCQARGAPASDRVRP